MYNKVYYLCEALVDQGRYIGEDPVGHSCGCGADYEVGGYAVCKHCFSMLQTEPERITFPHFVYPLEERISSWKEWVKKLIEETVGTYPPFTGSVLPYELQTLESKNE